MRSCCRLALLYQLGAVALFSLVSTWTLWNQIELRVVLPPVIDARLSEFVQSNSHSNINNISNNKTAMAGCLLVMDDNHFLVEWLAYHYHTLPLRRLVLAVDPRSQTSPLTILNRWRDKVEITTWNDEDFFAKNETIRQQAEYWAAQKFRNDHPSPSLIQHRARQRIFYYQCMQTLKQQGWSWTVLIDSDEFLRINYDTVHQYYQNINTMDDQDTANSSPPVQEPASVIRFLQTELQRPHPFPNITSPCVQIPRLRYGAAVDENQTTSTTVVPQSTSTSSFLSTSSLSNSPFSTLRFRAHAAPDNYRQNRISKVLIDLHRIPWSDLQPVESIHMPLQKHCARRKLHIRTNNQVLVIHHYLGTFAQYSYRRDSRAGKERSMQAYRKAARAVQVQDNTTTSSIVPWLDGFVQEVGRETAEYLLEGVGQLEPKKVTNE